MTLPICSVVIPTRNCLAYLSSALDSVRAQKIDGLEIIVVDDGSTDGTGDWLRGQARTWPHLRVIDGPARGPARARNLALAAANADLIAFLDADDMWSEGKLSRQIAFHQRRRDVGFSFTDYLHIDRDGGTHGTCFDYWHFTPGRVDASGFAVLHDPEATLLGANVVGTSAVVARRRELQIANGFGEDLRSAEDWDLWLRLAARAPVAATPLSLMTYLMHRPGNLTGQVEDRIAAMSDIVERYAGHGQRAFRRARRRAQARLAEASAEAAGLARKPWRSLTHRLHELSLLPSRRVARASVGDALGAAHALWRSPASPQ